jgi:hypothetical protein
MRADHKKAVKSSVFFALLGSLHAKAARKTLVKSTPDVNFTNILQAAFCQDYFTTKNANTKILCNIMTEKL